MKSGKNYSTLIVLLICVVCLLSCCAVVCVGAGGLVIYRNFSRFEAGDEYAVYGSVEEGDEAPDFELQTLDGETLALRNLRGGPVVLSFGASWCPPCRREVSMLQELHETYPDLFVLLVDIGEDYWTVQDFAADYGLSFTVALDEDEAVAIDYGIYGIPALFFIDDLGQVQALSVGAPKYRELEGYLELIGIETGGW